MRDDKQKRKGNTVVTSVSLTQEFSKLLDNYNLSPTEAMRRGVAVMLYDMGVSKYDTPLNKQRSDFVKAFMKKVEEEEKLRLLYENTKKVDVIYSNLNQLKKLTKDL